MQFVIVAMMWVLEVSVALLQLVTPRSPTRLEAWLYDSWEALDHR